MRRYPTKALVIFWLVASQELVGPVVHQLAEAQSERVQALEQRAVGWEHFGGLVAVARPYYLYGIT